MIDTSEEPRDQHYHFVHEFMRDSVFNYPHILLDQLSRGRDTGLRFLTNYWVQIPAAGYIPPDGLDYERFDLNDDFYGYLIRFPPPERVTEGHMAAILVSSHNMGCRYITLELGVTSSGSIETVLCEWSSVDFHKNYGTGPNPTTEEFIEAVKGLVIPKNDGRPVINKLEWAPDE